MRSHKKLTENAIAIYARINYNGLLDSDDMAHYDLLGEIVDYVTALSLTIFIADGDLGDEEAELLASFSSGFEGVGSGIPSSNHLSWAEAKLQAHKDFLRIATLIDDATQSCVSLTVLWHIKNIIMTLIDADSEILAEEIEVGKILLSDAEQYVASQGIASDTDLYDFPTDLVAAFTETIERQDQNHENSGESIEDLLEELNALAGLDAVKAEVATLVNLMKVRTLRENRGLKMPDVSLHMVFSGRPGTGKTTIGRLLGRIYRALEILPKGHLVEVDRSGLVAGYVGQTAIKCREALEKARGGILFIDEAYSLSRGNSENDYGQEAIDTILKYMEDHRDEVVVIVAGYDEEMKQFVSSNPGLQSRFNKFLRFEDYSIDELYAIFLKLVESHEYYYSEELAAKIYEHLREYQSVKGDRFANARDVRNAFETIIQEQANRIAIEGEGDDGIALHGFEDSDVDSAFKRLLQPG